MENGNEMNSTATFFLMLLVLLTATNARAAEEEKKSPWTSSAELGYVTTSGNTETETLNLKFDIAYEIDKWKHAAHVNKLDSSDGDVKSADKLLLTAQSNYKFTEYDYVYANVSYEDDKFSGFEYQAKVSVGYGRRLLHTDTMELDVEIGPGHRNFKVDNAPSSDDESLIRLAGKYLWKVSDTSNFTEDITYENGEDQEEWKSVTALTAKINSWLSMKFSHTVKYLDVVPAGNTNYDRETSVTLVYTF